MTIRQFPCKHDIMCQNWVGVRPMELPLGQCWTCSGTLQNDGSLVAFCSLWWKCWWLTHWPLGDVAVILKSIISKHMLRIKSMPHNHMVMAFIKFMGVSCEIRVRWMPQNTFDDQSTLVQVMAWCHQAPSHFLRKCWPRSLSPYAIVRPQWVKSSLLWQYISPKYSQ